MINVSDLTTKVDYHIVRTNNDFEWIGYVEVWDGETLVFHENLTPRPFDSSVDHEAVKEEAAVEAENILLNTEVQKFLDDYVFLKNNGLY
jgi:hypothetical protein